MDNEPSPSETTGEKENERRLAKFIKLWSCCCDVATETSIPVFEQENPRFSSSLPRFSDDSEFLHRFSLLERVLRVRLASNSGDGCSAVSSCTSPARFPGKQNIVGPQVLFSSLGPADSHRRLRGNHVCPWSWQCRCQRRSQAGYFGRFFWCSRHSSSGCSSATWWWTIQSFSRVCSRAGRADGGPDRAVFFLRVEAPQIQFNNRDVSTMSWAILRIINRVVQLQSPGCAFCHQLWWRLAPFAWEQSGALGADRLECIELHSHRMHVSLWSCAWSVVAPVPFTCSRVALPCALVGCHTGAWGSVCATVVSLSGAGGYQRCGFQSVRRYTFWRGTGAGGGGSSPGRRSKSLSETGKKWRATTPSIHLGVLDSLSVTPGDGRIWQQLGWKTVCVTSTPTAHTFFSCAFCQRACPSLFSPLSFRLESYRHTLTSRTCVAQAQHEALRTVSCPKSSHLIAECHTSHRILSITPGTCTPSLTRTTSLSSDPLLGRLQPCADLRQQRS